MMRGRLDFALSLAALALGFLVPSWPFVVAGALGAVVSGHIFVALTAAFLFDLLFGPWPVLPFGLPFTVVVAAVIALFMSMKRYIRSR